MSSSVLVLRPVHCGAATDEGGKGIPGKHFTGLFMTRTVQFTTERRRNTDLVNGQLTTKNPSPLMFYTLSVGGSSRCNSGLGPRTEYKFSFYQETILIRGSRTGTQTPCKHVRYYVSRVRLPVLWPQPPSTEGLTGYVTRQ